MCGLIGSVGAPAGDVDQALDLIAHRGPDGRGVADVGSAVLGHVRLAIIDPTDASAQPFTRGRITLTYNGELWNHRELRDQLTAAGETFTTDGDTEVVAAALARWGPAGLRYLDGMFALAWHDADVDRAWLARDRFGEIPLHRAWRGRELWWASEVKALVGVGCPRGSAVDVEPGGIVEVRVGGVSPAASPFEWYRPTVETSIDDREVAAGNVRRLLLAGTAARGLAADVPSCTLLSGGIDSAAVALHLRAELPDLVAYTAVLDPRSRDLRCARAVAEQLEIPLVEVAVKEPTADDLASVVAEIEMPHKAQVEIGWACLALADAMRGDGFKVTYSGEGSDELWASYGMSYHGIRDQGWRNYRARLIRDQARKNFARCNKVFMARSVEVRLPFLHRPLIEYGLALPQATVAGKARPKAVLQDAYRTLLPDEVIDRPKVAFQDGMKLKDACAAAVANPTRFYNAEFRRLYG